MTPSEGIQGFLKLELARRCGANPRYSLRAFARSLGVEPSALSKVLAGKRRMSKTTFERVAERMALGPKLAQDLAPPAKLRRRRGRGESHDPGAGQQAVSSTYRELVLDQDAFEILSGWYHLAILELTHLQFFRGDSRWIARTLGISLAETQAAIDRLVRCGYLETAGWKDLSGAVSWSKPRQSHAALRKFQAQILEKALAALSDVPIERRDNSSMTLAIDSRRLPEAKERIKRFRRELCEFLKGDSPPRDHVYHLAIALYPVTS